MVGGMKTTLLIDDEVMARLRQEAARRGTSMSHLVEAALRLLLDARKEEEELEPLPTWDSGGALVEVSDREALDRVMHEG